MTLIRVIEATVSVSVCEPICSATARKPVVSATERRVLKRPAASLLSVATILLLELLVSSTVTPARAGVIEPLTVALPPPTRRAGTLSATEVVVAGNPGVIGEHEPTMKSAPRSFPSTGETPPGARSTQ